MVNNIFYTRGKSEEKSNKKKFDLKHKKENTLNSLNEVEHFLKDYRQFVKYIQLYKWFNK